MLKFTAGANYSAMNSTGTTHFTITAKEGVANGTSEKHGSRKILSGSRSLGSVNDKSQSFVFSWFVFTFLSLETFYQRVSGSDF